MYLFIDFFPLKEMIKSMEEENKNRNSSSDSTRWSLHFYFVFFFSLLLPRHAYKSKLLFVI